MTQQEARRVEVGHTLKVKETYQRVRVIRVIHFATKGEHTSHLFPAFETTAGTFDYRQVVTTI